MNESRIIASLKDYATQTVGTDCDPNRRIIVNARELLLAINLSEVALRYRHLAKMRQKKVDRRKAKPR